MGYELANSSDFAAIMKSFLCKPPILCVHHCKTDSQESQTFGKPSFSKFRGSYKSQNPITFTCRLTVADKKRKKRQSTTAPAQTTHLSSPP